MNKRTAKALDDWDRVAALPPSVEPPQLTPDGRKLVAALTAMELEIDRLARFLTSRGGPNAAAEAISLHRNWRLVLCGLTTAQALANIVMKRPRTPGRLKGESPGKSPEGRRKKKT